MTAPTRRLRISEFIAENAHYEAVPPVRVLLYASTTGWSATCRVLGITKFSTTEDGVLRYVLDDMAREYAVARSIAPRDRSKFGRVAMARLRVVALGAVGETRLVRWKEGP